MLLPCPPPTLYIVKAIAPNKVLLNWSSAYPDYRLQSANALDGPGPPGFANVAVPPILVNGKFAVTNAVDAPLRFYRLEKRKRNASILVKDFRQIANSGLAL